MVSPELLDYIVIGHLTLDLTPSGPALGGSAAYAALTARALGMRPGIVTAWGNEIEPAVLAGIPLVTTQVPHSTTFENLYTAAGRVQYVRRIAPPIDFSLVPQAWRSAKIIHLAPLVQEIGPLLPEGFSPALLGMTPQGWLRAWDAGGLVHPCPWSPSEEVLSKAGAVVLGLEDVGGDEEQVEWLAQRVGLLVVTEGAAGARLFWRGDSRRFRPPQVTEVDATGAGDVFAASFFIRLLETRDPWEAMRFATRMGAVSVTRPGLQGVPTPGEVRDGLTEVVK